jgi:hypothetical protein
MLADRQMKVKGPRLRHQQEGEVEVPTYEALQENEWSHSRTDGGSSVAGRFDTAV